MMTRKMTMPVAVIATHLDAVDQATDTHVNYLAA